MGGATTTDTSGGAVGESQSSLTIICSDCARNGKTLFAKLVSDLLSLRKGQVPYIFDTDNPEGGLLKHFPDEGVIVDIGKVAEQVSLFDTVLSQSEKKKHFVVDLSARHRVQFFKIFEDIRFEAGAREAGVEVLIYYMIDRNETSVTNAAALASRLEYSQFIPIRNGAIGDVLDDWHVMDIYKGMRHQREIVLPALSPEALGMLEHPEFHFDKFVAGHYEHFSIELKTELWGFLESLYEQR